MTLIRSFLLSNTLEEWTVGFGAAVLFFVLLAFAKRVAVRRLLSAEPSNKARWDTALARMIHQTRWLFLYIVALHIGSLMLKLPGRLSHGISKTAFLALLIQMCLWATSIISYWVNQEVRAKATLDGARTQSLRAIGFLAKLATYVVILLWGLDNFGVNISTLVAGLGVGGIAVALAAQNILGDLFASLTIVLDKPFVYGDSIIVGEFKGNIEHVGMKTTRIRSQSGEEIIFPNSDLLQSRIRNYMRLRERRIVFKISVTYDTPIHTLKEIPKELERIIGNQPKVRFERAHLTQLGACSIDYEVAYLVLDPDYQLSMDTQQAIHLGILESFAGRHIAFAYPTQTVLVKQS